MNLMVGPMSKRLAMVDVHCLKGPACDSIIYCDGFVAKIIVDKS